MKLNGIDIDKFLDSLKDEKEKKEVLNILQEYAKDGKSKTYEEIMLEDYEEIPVDIRTFITDPLYLGNSYVDESGKCIVYPFWIEQLEKIFKGGKNNYQEVIFTGGIGLGKTTIAVIGASYVLYKLMCLRNPQEYYQLKSNARIYIAFFNINLDLAYGVAFKDMMQALVKSPWFLARGTVSGRKNIVYNPGKGIAFTVGSKPEHGLGRDIFCLHPLTKVKTKEGYKELKSIKDNFLNIEQYSIEENKKKISTKKHNSLPTTLTTEAYKVILEDGTEIIMSGNHEILKSDNSYIRADELKVGDDIKEVEKDDI